MHDVVVVGGGVIGLAAAFELAKDHSVLLLERGPLAEGTSRAAAGMLSPQSEADDDGPFFQLSMASLGRYRYFVDEIKEESASDPEYDDSGLLFVATSESEFRTLQARAAWQRAAGLSVEILTPAEVLRLEPLITANVSGASYMPGDTQVVPRKLLRSLAEACLQRGVRISTGRNVAAVLSEKGHAIGVRATDGEEFHSHNVVICSGVWSDAIEGLNPPIPVYPRKGQILSLTMPSSGAFKHMIRWAHSYFVPRRNNELILGATNEDTGMDRTLTVAGVSGLLASAQHFSTHVGQFPINEMWTGLRPATPDGLPILGESRIEGLFYATGHYRNGILLAPVTAAVVAAYIRHQASPLSIEAFRPDRFDV